MNVSKTIKAEARV